MQNYSVRFAAYVCVLLLSGTVAGSWHFAARSAQSDARALKTKAVVLIVMDGFRWQEVFNGAAGELMNAKYGGAQDEAALKKAFWRDTPEERRAAMMPFLWEVVAKHGQIYGNQKKGSVAQVTNGLKFSYPGYNEMSTDTPTSGSIAMNSGRIRT